MFRKKVDPTKLKEIDIYKATKTLGNITSAVEKGGSSLREFEHIIFDDNGMLKPEFKSDITKKGEHDFSHQGNQYKLALRQWKDDKTQVKGKTHDVKLSDKEFQSVTPNLNDRQRYILEAIIFDLGAQLQEKNPLATAKQNEEMLRKEIKKLGLNKMENLNQIPGFIKPPINASELGKQQAQTLDQDPSTPNRKSAQRVASSYGDLQAPKPPHSLRDAAKAAGSKPKNDPTFSSREHPARQHHDELQAKSAFGAAQGTSSTPSNSSSKNTVTGVKGQNLITDPADRRRNATDAERASAKEQKRLQEAKNAFPSAQESPSKKPGRGS